MPEPESSGPILDYANPRQNSKMRLPSQSVLTLRNTADGVEVVESQSRKGEALGAILFALLVVGWSTESSLTLWRESYPFEAILFNLLGIAMAAMIEMIINNMLRKTILTSRPGHLTLTFKSIFGTHRLSWSDEQIEYVKILPLAAPRSNRTIHELRIKTFTDAGANLFTGHPFVELTAIAERLGKGESNAKPPLAAIAIAPSENIDPKNSDQLPAN